MHHPERGLEGNPLAELGSQTYGNLSAKAAVSGAREDLRERSVGSSGLAGLFGRACAHASSQAWGSALSSCTRIGPERLGAAPAAGFPSPPDRPMDMIASAFMASCRPMPPSCASSPPTRPRTAEPTSGQAANAEALPRGAARGPRASWSPA